MYVYLGANMYIKALELSIRNIYKIKKRIISIIYISSLLII